MARTPSRLVLLALSVLGGIGLVPTTAQACAVLAPDNPSRAERFRDARGVIERAAVIIDGEVVRPFVRGGAPALVRAARVLKGPQREYFEVGAATSCDHALLQRGERLRLVLFGGPDLYFASYAGGDTRTVDRLLGSDRRREWPYFRGAASE